MQYSSNTLAINSHIPENNNLNVNNDYIPGKCNLGSEEIKMRKRNAKIGLILTLLSSIALQIFHSSPNYRLLILFLFSIPYFAITRLNKNSVSLLVLLEFTILKTWEGLKK